MQTLDDQGLPPISLQREKRLLRLKWHKFRRRGEDLPFSRDNLLIGLAAGASLEADVQKLACGRFVCLHDESLDNETTGSGLVADMDGEEITKLEMRGAKSVAPLLLDELVQMVEKAAIHDDARIQLDLKTVASSLDAETCRAFATLMKAHAYRFILSGCEWEGVIRLGGDIEGLALGYDPHEVAAGLSESELLDHIRETAPEAQMIYLNRGIIRASYENGGRIVSNLQDEGRMVDCWTVDIDSERSREDLEAAFHVGCDQLTTNTASEWHASAIPRSSCL